MDKIGYTTGCFLDKIGYHGCFHVREGSGEAFARINQPLRLDKTGYNVRQNVAKIGRFPNIVLDITGHTPGVSWPKSGIYG